MGKKLYAIKEGYDFINNRKIENMIVATWDECLSYVKGVKGAKYKSFETKEKAEEYLKDENKLLKKDVDTYPMNCPHAYVDGSFNEATGRYSYGLVIVHGDSIVYLEQGAASDDRTRALRQISGELRASVRAMEYAFSNNVKEIVIFHDYEGIYHHAVGTWERREESSKAYYEKMNELKALGNINVVFVKVDSHTGDLYNEIADEIAKQAAGLKLNGVVQGWLKNKHILVQNEKIKEILSQVGAENCNNILVIDN